VARLEERRGTAHAQWRGRVEGWSETRLELPIRHAAQVDIGCAHVERSQRLRGGQLRSAARVGLDWILQEAPEDFFELAFEASKFVLADKSRSGRGDEPDLVAKEGPQLHGKGRSGPFACFHDSVEALLGDRSLSGHRAKRSWLLCAARLDRQRHVAVG
jgi:hypothetical protein